MVGSMRLTLAALMLAVAMPALAQAPAPAGSSSSSGQRAIATACQADIKQYCAGVQEGENRIRDCLKPHAQNLSAGCKEAVGSAR
jgi:hypothetical protein